MATGDTMAQSVLSAAEAGLAHQPSIDGAASLTAGVTVALLHPLHIASGSFDADLAHAQNVLSELDGTQAAALPDGSAAQHLARPALDHATAPSEPVQANDPSPAAAPVASVTDTTVHAASEPTTTVTDTTPVTASPADAQPAAAVDQPVTATASTPAHPVVTTPVDESHASPAIDVVPITQAAVAPDTAQPVTDAAKLLVATAAVHEFLAASSTAKVLVMQNTLIVYDAFAVNIDLAHVQSVNFDFSDGSHIDLIGLPAELAHALAGHP